MLVAIFLIIGVSTGLARRMAWNRTEHPSLSLSHGYELALKSLGEDSDIFFCISANLAITRSEKGDWTFLFSSEKGESRWVIVHFSGKVEVLKEAPVY